MEETIVKKVKVLLEIFMVFWIENSVNKLDLLTPQDL